MADSLPQRLAQGLRHGEPQAVTTGPGVLEKIPVAAGGTGLSGSALHGLFPISALPGEGLPAEASVPQPEP